MASAHPDSFLEKHLACPICMEMFLDPRALPCMHTFCLTCLHSYIKSLKSTDDGCFECPVCRTRTSPPMVGIPTNAWAAAFPSNYTVKALVEDTRMSKEDDPRREGTSGNGYKHDRCHQHPKKKADFLCTQHTVIACSTCVAHYHRQCEHVIYLERDHSDKENQSHRPLSRLGHLEDKNSSGDGKNVQSDGDTHKLLSNMEHVTQVGSDASASGNDVIAASESKPKQKLRRLCDDRTDSTENVTVTQVTGTSNTNSASVSSDSSHREMPPLGQHSSMATSRTSDAHQIEQTYSFSVLNDILEEDRSETHFEKAAVSSSQLKLQDEFYVRIQDDKKCCSITAITFISNGYILLADGSNENLKLFNNAGEYISHLDLTSAPWDVTSIEQFEAAVTLPADTCIQLILVDEHTGMSIIRKIQVDRPCYGVSFCNRQLFVAMDNEIRILTYEGNLVKKIGRSSSRKLLSLMTSTKPLFDGARHLAIDRQHKHPVMYVSCVTSNNTSLIAMDRKGGVLSAVKTGSAGKMYGVSVCSDGRLLVCQSPKTLVMVSVDKHGSRSKDILEVENLQTAQFDHSSAKVYVSRKLNGFIRVYAF